jgi:tetratricopeptide (TPR) repeat protein
MKAWTTYSCCFLFLFSAGQETDSIKLKELIGTVTAIYRAKRDTAMIMLVQGEKMLNKLQFKTGAGKDQTRLEFYDVAATVYHEAGKAKEALKYYDLLLDHYKSRKDTVGMANIYYGMGMLHSSEGNIPLAIQCHSIALHTFELKNDLPNVALQWYSLAQIYAGQRDSTKHVEYLSKALNIYESQGNQWGIALVQGAFGHLYLDRGNSNLALKFFKRNLDIYSGSGDLWGIGNSLYSMGSAYRKMKNMDSALSNYTRALALQEKTGYKPGLTFTYNSLAELFGKTGNLNKAVNYGTKALSLAREVRSITAIRAASNNLHFIYKKQGDFKRSFEMFTLYVRMTDSIQNEKNKKAIYQQQLSYEFEKRAAIEEQDQKSRDAISLQEKERQKVAIYAISTGLFLALFVVIFVFRGYRQKQRANFLIMGQKRLIEEKQRSILDSIHYAKRIQLSLMPTEKYIIKKLSELGKKY